MSPTKCASHHFGPWAIEPAWFANAISAVQSGVLQAQRQSEMPAEDVAPPAEPYDIVGQTAVIALSGPLMKIRSKFGGTSTIDARNAVRKAGEDNRVDSVLLVIDSPGGTAAGTDALARDVADCPKPIHAHIEDMGASAAYYVACQADRVTASPTSLVGSLGTRMSVIDSSAYYATKGMKVYELASGEFKGAGEDGTPITERQLAYFQGIVNDFTDHFKRAVAEGRGMDMAAVDAVFDGRVHDAATATTLGLVDGVESLDSAMQALTTEVRHMQATEFRQHFEANPEAEEVKELFTKGFNAGAAATVASERARMDGLLQAYGEQRVQLALKAFAKGQTPDQAKAIAEALDAETARLVAENTTLKQAAERAAAVAGVQGAVNTGASADVVDAPAADPKADAAAAWDAMSDDEREAWASKEVFIRARCRAR